VSEYLVRWTFGANNQLRSNKREVVMYQFHKDKKEAVDHYVSLLNHTSPAMGMTTEIFQLVQLVPGEPEPEEIVDESEPNEVARWVKDFPKEDRDKVIFKQFKEGFSRKEIADQTGLSYGTVTSIIRRLSDSK
jgi:DNA-directed RNA polymerase specialized sigma24 family protein